MKVPTMAVVGTGPVSHALARRHVEAGGVVSCVVSRDASRAAAAAAAVGAGVGTVRLVDALAADVVLVAVSDAAVGVVGRRLQMLEGAEGSLVLHTSGALSGADLRAPAVRAGSLHPLQSLSWPAGGAAGDAEAAALLAGRLRDVHWFHEGEGAAVARELVALWGGLFHALRPGGKALYHAGAAVLSNHTVALYSSALRLFVAAGIPADEAAEPLQRLLAGTATNLAEIGLPGALTGPVARGDVGTVRAHLEAIARAAPDLLPSYSELARLAIDVALAKGTLDAAGAGALRALLG